MRHEDDEWYVLMDHATGLIVYYDPFAKSYTDLGERTALEDHAMEILAEQEAFARTRQG